MEGVLGSQPNWHLQTRGRGGVLPRGEISSLADIAGGGTRNAPLPQRRHYPNQGRLSDSGNDYFAEYGHGKRTVQASSNSSTREAEYKGKRAFQIQYEDKQVSHGRKAVQPIKREEKEWPWVEKKGRSAAPTGPTKEYDVFEMMGSCKKFYDKEGRNMQNRENPAPWPGKKGYPPNADNSGKPIDYSLRENGGVFMKKFVHKNEAQQVPTSTSTSAQDKARARHSLSDFSHPLGSTHDRSIAPGIDGEYKFVVPGAAQALKFRAPLCKAEQVQYMKEGGPTRAELGLSTDAHRINDSKMHSWNIGPARVGE
uniref:Uncharacterized protein n=1 Tax=Palpitomonas bilix TaxID=652834 RepID=A0A7S3FYU4_9EUKA|mmetsp:Transcript_11060/g.29015  ORF Transcript_11060/g.29015 Transcript_11060/m.29015 type:complete len:311 (+) Transcript_11060:244-1176(+)